MLKCFQSNIFHCKFFQRFEQLFLHISPGSNWFRIAKMTFFVFSKSTFILLLIFRCHRQIFCLHLLSVKIGTATKLGENLQQVLHQLSRCLYDANDVWYTPGRNFDGPWRRGDRGSNQLHVRQRDCWIAWANSTRSFGMNWTSLESAIEIAQLSSNSNKRMKAPRSSS